MEYRLHLLLLLLLCLYFLSIKRNRLTSLWIKIAVIYEGEYMDGLLRGFFSIDAVPSCCTFADGRDCFPRRCIFFVSFLRLEMALLGIFSQQELVGASLRVTCSSTELGLFVFLLLPQSVRGTCLHWLQIDRQKPRKGG